MEDKRALRMRLRAARASRAASELIPAGAGFARHGVAVAEGVSTVAAYASVGDEPPTRPLLDALRLRGLRVLLPRVDGDDLEWASYESWTELRTTDRGLLEPVGNAVSGSLAEVTDLVLAPALAVDRHGNRLGRGAGYYDRALKDVARGRIIAAVFDDEVLDELPAEPHDVPVAAALTPSGLVRFDDQ